MDLSRSEILLGKEHIHKLQQASVCIFGVGGVGSYAAEALARSGVGEITVVDYDKVSTSNINRQIPALSNTVGLYKADVMAERMLAINPDAKVHAVKEFCTPLNVAELLPEKCDFVVDAVDTVSAKIAIILESHRRKIPIISCMGAGNKKDPTKIHITDIYKTSNCPLCRVMRHELRKKEVDSLNVVYSTELPIKTDSNILGSLVYVTAVSGLFAARHVIENLNL